MRKDVLSAGVASQPDSLADEVISLREEVRVLRDVLDELREEFTYAARNGHVALHVTTSVTNEPRGTDKPPLLNPGKQQRLF